MLVIDGRTHVGQSKNTSAEIAADEIVHEMDRNGVDAAIVQPLPSAADVADYVSEHDLVLELAQRHPGRIFGLACIPPQIGRDKYFAETHRYVNELGFVGLKFHPLFHGGSIISKGAKIVYDAGRELGVSVSVHTGPGLPWTLPSLMIPIAQEYPEVTFILVHSGGWLGAEDAVVAAQQCENLLLDSSWHYPITVARFVREVGADRIMMASDFPANLPMQMTLWDSLPLTEEEKQSCLGGLAINTFGLADRIGAQ